MAPRVALPGGHPDEATEAPLQSRRMLLAAAVGGLVGSVAAALGRPTVAEAAAGDTMKVGRENFAGASGTQLFATSSGGAFWATQYGFGSGVRGDSVSGHGGVFATQHGDRYGLNVSNTNTGAGTGGAINADGGAHLGLRVAAASTAILATSVSDTAIDATMTEGVSSAIHGFAKNTTGGGIGVAGVSWGASGFGLLGSAIDSSGTTHGVYGSAGSPNGVGVEGYNPQGYGMKGLGALAGVQGTTPAEFGAGVEGSSAGSSGHGVVGFVTSDSGTAAGVYGSSAGSNSYAGYFEGNAAVTGTLSKGGGSFRIDHPLDPANRILQHSFVESPDMKNIYDGVVTADAAGTATVGLPSWFDALNRDVRYGLTALGSAMPDLHVSELLHDNEFAIAGARPGGQVSWQVTGIRRDAWAEANRIVVELDKTGSARGRYLHPREHGQPPSRGVDYHMQQRRAASIARAERANAVRREP
jgi:hypothetical protein